MKQGGSQRRAGFTIIEVLIVLAVTGALFVSAAILIGGRQNKTEFTVAIQALQQRLQQIINETSSGYYPNQSFSCGATTGQPNVSVGTNGQGTKNGCVFLGKVVQFGEKYTPNAFIVIPVTGNQSADDITDAYPLALTANNGTPLPYNGPDLSSSEPLENGLTAHSMYYNGNPGNATAGVGFLAGNNAGVYATAGGGGLANGSLQLSLWAVPNTQVGVTTKQDMAGQVDATGPPPNNTKIQPVNEVDICVNSGTTQQSGLITIGGGTGGLAVHLQIRSSQC